MMGQQHTLQPAVPTSDVSPPQAEDAQQTHPMQSPEPDLTSILIDYLEGRVDASRLSLVSAHQFADCRALGEALIRGDLVLLDARPASDEVARRVVDFAAGATFALRGRIQLVGFRIYIVCPEVSRPTDANSVNDRPPHA